MRNGKYNLVVASPGYPGKRYRGRYCYEHHDVLWRTAGRVLRTGEQVHHLNGNKRDNTPTNLAVLTASQHSILHGEHRRVGAYIGQCITCGSPFCLRWRNQRRYFCSRRCSGAFDHRKNTGRALLMRIASLPVAA